LFESELFGHEKGAFTDATKKYESRFQLAHQGTIFLNEIGDLPLELQVKLLKVIEQKKIEPVGSSVPISVDVRIISATNRDIDDLIGKGLFREDLYYRLKVLKIEIPTLKQRKEDIPLLIDFFIKKRSEEKQKEIVGITNEAKKYLEQREYDGNVRQLENLLKSAVERADRLITLADLVEEKTGTSIQKSDSKIVCSKEKPKNDCPIFGELNIDEIEKIAIICALKSSGGYVEPACEKLGISKANMYNKINLYRLKDLVRGYGPE
jgi:transcriptional regulator with PAS, ATPase and Fis domain